VYRGTDNHIYELARNASNGSWSNADLTAITSAPNASGDPVGLVRHNGTNVIVYRSTAGRIIQLTLSGIGWTFTDLSAAAGATDSGRLVGFGPRPLSRPDQLTSIAYVDANQRIQVLTLDNSGAWSINDLSATTGTTTNVVVPYIRSDNNAALLHINSDGHVREAAFTSTGLVASDLTQLSGGPAALNPSNGVGSVPMGYVRTDNLTTVVYKATNSHVIELFRSASGTWLANDLTSIVGSL